MLVLEQLSADNIKSIITNTLANKERGLGNLEIAIDDDAFNFIVDLSHGEARVALNTLESAIMLDKAR